MPRAGLERRYGRQGGGEGIIERAIDGNCAACGERRKEYPVTIRQGLHKHEYRGALCRCMRAECVGNPHQKSAEVTRRRHCLRLVSQGSSSTFLLLSCAASTAGASGASSGPVTRSQGVAERKGKPRKAHERRLCRKQRRVLDLRFRAEVGHEAGEVLQGMGGACGAALVAELTEAVVLFASLCSLEASASDRVVAMTHPGQLVRPRISGGGMHEHLQKAAAHNGLRERSPRLASSGRDGRGAGDSRRACRGVDSAGVQTLGFWKQHARLLQDCREIREFSRTGRRSCPCGKIRRQAPVRETIKGGGVGFE